MQGRMEGLGAIVLCGGESRRMGMSKAQLPFGQERLLQRVVRILSEVAQPIVVVAAPGQPLPEIPATIELLRDDQPGRGPLEGLRVGLERLSGRVATAYATGCDYPLLSPRWVRGLVAWTERPVAPDALRGRHHASLPSPAAWQIAVPCDGAFHHWLAALYRPTVAPILHDLLAGGCYRTGALLQQAVVAEVPVEALRDFDPELGSLTNVNQPQAYLEALARCGLQPEEALCRRLNHPRPRR